MTRNEDFRNPATHRQWLGMGARTTKGGEEMSEKELKLIIAGQCMASLLYKNTGYQMTGSIKPRGQTVKRQYEEIALKSWEAATELMALSKKEEDKK